MELMLRTLTPRNLLLAAGLVALFRLGDRYGASALARYQAWRHPRVVEAPSPLGAEIMARKEQRESRALKRRYERLAAALQRRRALGLDTSRLESKAAAALKLDTPALRAFAIKALAEVERDMPPIKLAGRPAPAAEEEPPVPPDVTGRRAKRRGSR